MIILQCASIIIVALLVLYLLIVQWVFWGDSHRKPLNEEIPSIGDLVPFYDDGKTGESRRFIAKVTNIYTFHEFQKKHPNEYKGWKEDSKHCSWVFAETTDLFIEAEIPEYDEMPIYFARSEDDGWFSFEYDHFWMSGRLDVDGYTTARVFDYNIWAAVRYNNGKLSLPTYNSELPRNIQAEIIHKFVIKGLPSLIKEKKELELEEEDEEND